MRVAANLFALRSTDPVEVEGAFRLLVGAEEFTPPRRAGAWLTATSALPGTPDDSRPAPGILMAEGFEVLSREADRSGGQDGWAAIARRALDRPETLAALPGDFGFVAIDESEANGSGQAVVVRSCGGLAPFYLYEEDGLVAIATRVADLVRFVPRNLKPDPLVWAAMATGSVVNPDDRGSVTGSRAVPRGCAAVVEPGRRGRFVRYFDPRPARWPAATPERRAEHVTRLGNLVFTALEEELDPTGGNLLTLSGGVDSSTLGALSAGKFGYPVATVSFVPPLGAPEAPSERRYVEGLAETVPFTRQVIVGTDLSTWLETMEMAPPVAFPLVHNAHCILGGLAEEMAVRVVFGGEHADEICGAPITVPDWAMATSPFGLLRSLTSLPSGSKDLARWAAWRVLWAAKRPRTYHRTAMPAPIAPEIDQEYREWNRRFTRIVAPRGPWRFLTLWHAMDGWVGIGWEAATAIGARRSTPFLSRASLELVYDCHPSELVGPGPKRLLRDAFDGLVPPANLYRPDRGRTVIPLPDCDAMSWNRPLPEVVHPIVGPVWQGSPARVGFDAAIALTALEVAGRCFEKLSREKLSLLAAARR